MRRVFHGDAPGLGDLVGDVSAFTREVVFRRHLVTRVAGVDRFGDVEVLWRDLLRRGTRQPLFRVVRAGTTSPKREVARRAGIGNYDLDDLVSANDVIDHYRRGDTVVLQGLHHTNPHLAKLANNVALAVDHPVQVNAYLSPADARGLDLHFDFHDVFVVQLGGSKRWRIWAPLERTTNPVKGRRSVPALRSEELGEPLLELTMGAGDCLYLPRGYPHAAETVDQHSEHLTIGLVAVTWQRILRKAIDAEVAKGRLTSALPVGMLEPGLPSPLETLDVSAFRELITPDTLRHWTAREIWRRQPATRLRPRAVPSSGRASWCSPPARCCGSPPPAPRRCSGSVIESWTCPCKRTRSCRRCSTPSIQSPRPAWRGSTTNRATSCSDDSSPRGCSSMSTRYECSATSDRRDEAMFATGSLVRGWLLIEVRGAWGPDGIHDSAFGAHVPPRWKDDLKRHQIRAVCIRSHLRSDATDVRLFACAARRPGTGSAPLWRRDVASLADVIPAAAELRVSERPGPEWARLDEPLILVCTNGRHDQCCANRGRPLVRSLYDSPWADRVWECSHIGGDRFAANLVVLPDSLYFGRVDADIGTGAAPCVGRGTDRSVPLPWPYVVLPGRAGGRALRSARAPHRCRRRGRHRRSRRPTVPSWCSSPNDNCTSGCIDTWSPSPSQSPAKERRTNWCRRSRSDRSPTDNAAAVDHRFGSGADPAGIVTREALAGASHQSPHDAPLTAGGLHCEAVIGHRCLPRQRSRISNR